MKRMILLFFLLGIWGVCFSQVDNIYGDFLIAKSKKNISMDLKDVSLIDLLKVLSQQSGLNFICTEAVKNRKVSLYIENAPLKEVIDVIFKANNLSYDYYPKANIFIVKELGKPTIELKTKVYKLKYIRVKNSRIQKEIENLIAEEEEDEEEEEKEGIKAAVEKILSEYGKVIEEPLTNSLIVVDVPSQFPIIDEVIKTLDVAPPKVLIEVEMLDVSKDLVDKLGLKFGEDGFISFTGGSRTTAFPFPHRLAGSNKGTLTMGTLSLASFTATLNFLSKDTSTKFIARPKILTLSNETSEVNLTVNEAIGVTTTETETGSTQEVEREETGTKLRVTPQVNLDTGEITMVVEVFSKEAKDSGISVSGLVGNLKNPEERGTKSVIRLKDGETLFIGGLIKNDRSETITKIPLLGDLPLLGALFRHRNKTKDEERELLVFITPRIVKEGSDISGIFKTLPREQSTLSQRKKAIELVLDQLSKKR
ncbi:MAG: hypothetical protein J7K17_04425 [Candidatus Omnitrophica bacterium]|nr:hypothetical protein [Candidatus Omnitrophota bacterium]